MCPLGLAVRLKVTLVSGVFGEWDERQVQTESLAFIKEQTLSRSDLHNVFEEVCHGPHKKSC